MTVHAKLKPVASYQSDYEAIVGILNDYFDGLFEGDVEKLRSIFHADAWPKLTPHYLQHTLSISSVC